MKQNLRDEYATLVCYFLGELAEAEQEFVEERYMLDRQYSELRDEVEMDLVDAYAAGTLTPKQRHDFERHFLITNQRKEAVRAAFLTKTYRNRIARETARQSPVVRASGSEWRLASRTFVPVLAVALAVVAIGAGLALMTLHRMSNALILSARNLPQPKPPMAEQPRSFPRKAVGHAAGNADAPVLTAHTETSPLPETAIPAQSQPHRSTPAPSAAPSPAPDSQIQREPPASALVIGPQLRPSVEPEPTASGANPAPNASYVVYGTNAILSKLLAEYQLTKPNYDKTDIVTAGSVVVLRKDKVLMLAASSSANPCKNTYKDGVITQNKPCTANERLKKVSGFLKNRIPDSRSVPDAPASRALVAGEKLWITNIVVKDEGEDRGISIDFLTDKIGEAKTRFTAKLEIPFGASTPTPEQALQLVREVIAVAPPGEGTAAPVNSPPVPSPDATTAPSPPPVPVVISVGDTIDQVVAVLGQPRIKAKVGAMDIYEYKDIKITFTNGKVTAVQ